MRRFQILIVLCLLVLFQIGFWGFSFLSYRYINQELFEQVLNDNSIIGEQMAQLMIKTGITAENPETDSILQSIFENVKLPNGGFVCAVNPSGQLIAGPGLKPGMKIFYKPVLREIGKIKQEIGPEDLSDGSIFKGYAYFKEKDRLDLVASIPVGKGLRLFVHQDSSFIKQNAWISVKRLILFGFLVTFFVVVFGWMATKKVIEHFEIRITDQNIELKAVLAQLDEKQAEIVEKNKELEIQQNEVQKSNHLILEKSKEITDSINYAQRIQKAAMPKKSITNTMFEDHFVLFLPRDVVSGDFFWYYDFEDFFVITVADCTGHGVPGAFMSMLGITYLNEIVIEKKIKDPGVILENMRRNVIKALGQEFGKNMALDGINMALCLIDKAKLTLEYAGAYNPVIIARGNEMIKLEGDRMPVGIHGKMEDKFSNKSLVLQSGDILYLYSDGFVDQFGGTKGRKFMTKNFQSLINEIKVMDMAEQKNILEYTFVEWKGTYHQVDDVLVIGLKIR
jgi:serine phosphatase RsbU (regulator of sigma subunit)